MQLQKLQLQKLHGLGNDFLVVLADEPVAASVVRALCERRTGIGADGLLRAWRDGDQVRMRLLNADGSVAEMSGNGIRCFGLALHRAGWWDRTTPLQVLTDAGVRTLDWLGGDDRQAEIRVDMGPVKVIERTDAGWAVDAGNPHLVKLVDGTLDEVEMAGVPIDTNVEWVVRGPGVGHLSLRVHERGVGETMACGTGSCAAAAAAHEAGWVGRLVTVHNPGGAVVVDLSQPSVRLTGPATFVADVDVPTREAVPA